MIFLFLVSFVLVRLIPRLGWGFLDVLGIGFGLETFLILKDLIFPFRWVGFISGLLSICLQFFLKAVKGEKSNYCQQILCTTSRKKIGLTENFLIEL